MAAVIDEARAQRASFYNDPKVRSRVAQVIFLLLLVWVGYEIVHNTSANLTKLGKNVDFLFLWGTAGFDIIQRLIEYTRESTYLQAVIVGFLNTLIIAALGIIFATILGFLIGIMRLSSNWLVAKLATGYVEIIRNIPLLLQIFFWYTAVLKPLPGPKESLSFLGFAFLSNRGLIIPKPIWSDGAGFVGIAFIIGCIGAIAISRWARQRQERTGEQFPELPGRPRRHYRLAAHRLPRRRRSGDIRVSCVQRVQFRRRHDHPAGVDRTASGAVDLYRVLHCGDRPRRHPGGESRPDGSRTCLGPEGAADIAAGHRPAGLARDHSAA